MFLQLYQIKKHLNIDDDYHADDEYLCDLAKVSEEIVERHISDNLQDIARRNGGELPSPLLQAMLLMIGNLYANRENVAFAQSYKIPLAYEYLLGLYVNYKH